jgi:hypothetical protein
MATTRFHDDAAAVDGLYADLAAADLQSETPPLRNTHRAQNRHMAASTLTAVADRPYRHILAHSPVPGTACRTVDYRTLSAGWSRAGIQSWRLAVASAW